MSALVYPETQAVDEVLVSGPVDRITWEEAQALEFRQVELGEHFGPPWTTFWFRIAATVPEEWRDRRVDLLFVSHSEATLWVDGRVVQGLNTGGAGERPDARLVDRAEPGARLACQVELACNGMFGGQEGPYRSLPKPVLDRCEIALFDADAWRLLHDFETLRSLEADGTDLDPSFAGLLRSELNRFCNEWDPDILTELHEHTNATHAHELAALGHAHIDTAWLWPLAETYRKTVRTFSSQLRYMEEYPEYRFACSQAQQYAWIKDRNPDLWDRVRGAVAAGQFVPVGGSWVEPDCNIPSGESLLRQFLQGQRFFEQELGRRCNEFWSPDAFGYTGQLPQLMRESGLTRFLTQKLSWNRFNKPEHHTFVWQGIDGSEVLGHFPPADTYSSEASVPELRRSARDYKDHEQSQTSLLLFGYGDGGGGPTRTMLETLRRVRDLQGVPRTTMRTSDEFFEALEAEPAERPVVVGELYFEYHRGTYTTQARTKRLNRRCESALHDAEFLCAVLGDEPPRAELDRLWKLLLLNQFHDILPGSSIGVVHEESERDLAEVEAGANALCDAVLGGSGEEPVNTIGFARRDVEELPGGGLGFVVAPSYGFGDVAETADRVRVDGLVLENAHLRATLSPDGSLTSLVEKPSAREALAAPGNRLELYEDLPVAFDAWDIDPSHLETRRDAEPATSHRILTESPLRAEVEFVRTIGTSTLTQVVRLDAESRRLEFRTTVDWHERHTLLKVCFPVDVRASNATYETAFGYAERPTHFSTSFDRAKYEVPGHRFADLSEHGFGVALLTDCKYGYSCLGGELRISLLRSPTSPDPEADQGRHEFAYAVMPHAGGWREAGVVAEARRFNAPIRWAPGGIASGSLASVDDPNVVLDTIKPAEDSDAIVLRLYEAHGARGTARVRLGLPYESAVLANALEDERGPLEIVEDEIVLPYRPHQILTVKVS